MRIITIKDEEIIHIGYYPNPMNANIQEGLQEDGTYIILREELDGLDAHDFIKLRYYNGTELLERTQTPGEFFNWLNGQWVLDQERYLSRVRLNRQILLYKCDWTQLHDAPITVEQDEEVTIYRQALRDMIAPILADPQAYVQIEDAPWPTPPEWLNVS